MLTLIFTFFFYADEEDVKGLCGLHKDYDMGTKDSKRKRYPWVAFVIVQVKVSLFNLIIYL